MLLGNIDVSEKDNMAIVLDIVEAEKERGMFKIPKVIQ